MRLAILFLLLLAAPLHAQGQSRSKVRPGDSLVCWDRQSRLPREWKLTQGATSVGLTRRNTGRDASWFDPSYHGEVTIPANTRPGAYKVVAGQVEFPVEVVAPIARKPRKALGPGTKLVDVQKTLSDGNDVLLNPGLYEWSDSLRMPPGSTLSGPGAIIRYSGPPLAYGEEGRHAVVSGAEWTTIEGITFDAPSGSHVIRQKSGDNITMKNCKFLQCTTHWTGTGFVAEGCEWVGGGCFSPPGLYRRCTWRDTSGAHAFICWAADRNLAMVDCLFLRTDRGPCFQCHWGNVRGNLFLGTRVFDANSENGSESFLEESPDKFGFHDNLILHTRTRGNSPIVQWDVGASGNLVKECRAVGGGGFVVWGPKCTNNTFEDFELRDGPGIFLGDGTAGNTFRNGAIVNWSPGSWGQYWIPLPQYDADAAVYWSNGPPGANKLENVTFRLQPGVKVQKAASPLTFTGCRLNGAVFLP